MKKVNDQPAHLRYQTQLSTTGEINMSNRKPYRTKALKAEARKKAVKRDNGTWHCPRVPTRTHPPARG